MINPPNLRVHITTLVLAFGASFLNACAPLASGIAGYDSFIANSHTTVYSGPQPVAVAAKCFELNAGFLPLSEFTRDNVDGSFTYRLRVAGVWYEQVHIAPETSGSRAEMRLSPGLNAKWKLDFERDRAAVAARCVSSAIYG